MAKFANFEEMVDQAGKSYKAKATGEALAEGLAPYAPAGQTVRASIRDSYNAKVGRVAGKFRELWGDLWRGRVFGPK